MDCLFLTFSVFWILAFYNSYKNETNTMLISLISIFQWFSLVLRIGHAYYDFLFFFLKRKHSEFSNIGTGLSGFCCVPLMYIYVCSYFYIFPSLPERKWDTLIYLKAEQIKASGELKRGRIHFVVVKRRDFGAEFQIWLLGAL